MKIALIGKSGSGKDTVSNILVSNYGFKKINFSDDIYKIAREIFQMKDKDRNYCIIKLVFLGDFWDVLWIFFCNFFR